ncbi:MAG TPA: DUF2127 domain-containing protein [Gemmatimonadaceae bacterium]
MTRPTTLHRVFRLGLLLKAVDGALEFGGGLVLMFMPSTAINSAVWFLIRGELREDPKDLVANLFLHASTGVVAAHVFAGALL